MASRKRKMSNDAAMHALYKEWDETSCAICMEHPHNAVLLLCSSHDKGCRSYICNTSYRHSNCLDRFRKLKDDNKENNTSPILNLRNQHNMDNTTNGNIGLATPGDQTEIERGQDVSMIDHVATDELHSGLGVNNNHITNDSLSLTEVVSNGENITENLSASLSCLRCPLCRGSVLGWQVVEEARRYLNLKSRSCSSESCSFSGNYRELRYHARRVHPTVRPADIDPSRQRAWTRLENEREYDDIVSAIRSAVPGAVVLGDYVIENGGDRLSGERVRSPGENRWLSTFFLFEMIGSMPVGELRGDRSRALSRHPRTNGSFPRRRFIWGENLLGVQDDDDDDDDDEGEETEINMLSDTGDDISPNHRRRTRQRLMHFRADEDQR